MICSLSHFIRNQWAHLCNCYVSYNLGLWAGPVVFQKNLLKTFKLEAKCFVMVLMLYYHK